jgi:hypothetical protein
LDTIAQKWNHHEITLVDVLKGSRFVSDDCVSFTLNFTLNSGENVTLTLDFDFPVDEGAWKTAVESKITEQAKELDQMRKQMQEVLAKIRELNEKLENFEIVLDGKQDDEIDNEPIQLPKKRKVNDKPV